MNNIFKIIKSFFMNKTLHISIIKFLFIITGLSFFLLCCKKEEKKPVKLVFASWRMEDTERMNRINTVFTSKYPHINVEFRATKIQSNTFVYTDFIKDSLNAGVGPDIIFLQSYEPGQILYNEGHLLELNQELDELKDIPEAAVKAWSTDDGKIYGLPSVGVTHGIFYRKDIFKKYNLSTPETWEDFLNICEILKKNGETVFAQGTLNPWTLYEVIFSGLGPNLYGGEKSRQALIKGEMKLTDPLFIRAFKELDKLQAYFPPNYKSLDYAGMQLSYGGGNAVMYIGGSWEISIFEDLGILEKTDWFPPPVLNRGDTLQFCFHVDAALGINKNTMHLKEALLYLKWAASTEYAELFMNELPGFFSYTGGQYNLNNRIAKKMIDTVENSETTVRTTWEKLSAQKPLGNILMTDALKKMYYDEFSPQEAAAYVQENLETWYGPFQK